MLEKAELTLIYMLSKTKKVITTSHPVLCSIASYKQFYSTTPRVGILSLLFLPPTEGGGMEINMLKTVREVLAKRKEINDEDEYNVEKSRERLIELLSRDEAETISILNQLNELEVLYTSEVFEEIAYNLQSEKYIECLKEIQKKYNEIDIADAIEVAEEYI